MEFKSKSFNVRLKDGTIALIKAFPPEALTRIKEINPQEGEFVLEAQKGDQVVKVDARDIEDISDT